jgi:L-alanine-DL-glutamate epimerase-like enolase superfamily enzyme
MKIVDITLTQEKIRLKVPFITALREVHFAEFVRLKMVCDDGHFAYGEAPATKAITGETLESITKAIESIKPLLVQKELREALKIVHQQSCGSSAKAALDMAIVTLLAQEKEQTLFEYFVIKDTTPLQTDITISLNSQEKMLREAKEAFENGMDILKIKLGDDIVHAVAVTQLLAKELPKATLLIDANQAWSEAEGLEYLAAVEGLAIALLEQPVVAKDIAALKRVTHATKLPVLADEAVFTLEDVQKVVALEAADMINIKLMKCGGVSKAVEILEYARKEGITCMLGSMIEGPYSINITLYLAFAYRDVVQFIDLDSPLLYKEFPTELDFVYDGAVIFLK